MIKNIKIIAGSSSCEYILSTFFNDNSESFRKQKILCVPLSHFFRDDYFPDEKFFKLTLSELCVKGANFAWEDALMSLETAKQKFANREEETLLIFSEKLFINERYKDFFIFLSQVFSENSPINLDFYFLYQNIVEEFNNKWICDTLSNTPTHITNHLVNCLNAKWFFYPRKYSKIYTQFLCKQLLQTLPDNVLFLKNIQQECCDHESMIIPMTLKFLNLNFAYVQKPQSFIFSPDVVSYIKAVYAYFAVISPIDWLSQTRFLNYKIETITPYTYIKPYGAKKLYQKFWYSSHLVVDDKIEKWIKFLEQIAEVQLLLSEETSKNKKTELTNLLNQLENKKESLRNIIFDEIKEKGEEKAKILFNEESYNNRPKAYDALNKVTKENALILGELLEKEFRQFLLKHLKRDTLKYQSQSIRNLFAALLKIEGEIDDETFCLLTQNPLGTVLTGDEGSQKNPLESPKVTVLTLAYNQEKFIEKQIKSVIMQKTNFPVSHIIIDDCSTDGTRDILKKYASMYPHITLILREKNKIYFSIYALYDQINSPYVALCDGDDYFTHPDKLQRQVNLLEANPDFGLTFHTTEFFYEGMDDPDGTKGDSTGWHAKYHPRNWPEGKKFARLAELLKGNLIQTNSVMYRWRFQEGVPLWFTINMTPGDWYWHILHAETGKIGFDPEVMSAYVRHPEGIFSQTVHSVAKHRRKYGKHEISFFELLNFHFEGRYESRMRNGQASVFVTLGKDAMDNNDFTYYLSLCKTFPCLCDEFDINVERIEKTAELAELKKKLKETSNNN